MADEDFLHKVHSLSDLELAVLLSLIAREHCLVSTPAASVDTLVAELCLLSVNAFRLRPAVVSCHPATTLDDFAAALLLPPAAASPTHHHHNHVLPDAHVTAAPAPQQQQIANVVVAAHLDRAPRAVQIQALELLRTRRVFTRSAVHAAPRPFLLVAVVAAGSGGDGRVTPHLNDALFLAHWHDPEEAGFVHVDEREAAAAAARPAADGPVVTEAEVSCLAELARRVELDVDVLRYQMDIVSFLRMHRAVAGGVTPTATKHFEQLARSLAPLHGLDYVTPSLVALAARKIYLHRIKLVSPERERSMQWGSDLAAVEAILEGVGPEEVIEEVLQMVTAPV